MSKDDYMIDDISLDNSCIMCGCSLVDERSSDLKFYLEEAVTTCSICNSGYSYE